MAERRKRSEGARAESETLRTAAREKDRAHREALRKARAEVFRGAGRGAAKGAGRTCNTAVQQARTRANDEIQAAKGRLGCGASEAAREEP